MITVRKRLDARAAGRRLKRSSVVPNALLVAITVLGVGGTALAGIAGTAAAAGTYQTTAAVNVRQSAGTGGTFIRTEPQGASFNLNCQVQNSTNVNGNRTWDNVRFADSTVGYIADYYTTTPSFNSYAPGTGDCNAPPPPSGGPPGYSFCANEGQRCNFSGTMDVAYGANGKFAYKSGVTGGIDCTNAVFGDPNYGAAKACYTKASAPSGGPSGYSFCASEGQRCNFSGTMDIAYGANGSFAYKSGVTGGIDCTNAVFGDPNYGVVKACYTRASGGTGVPPGYSFCANEGQRCNFSGTMDVAYGANGNFAYKSGVTGGVDCTNAVFGDPNYGVVKACYTKASTIQKTWAPWSRSLGYHDQHDYTSGDPQEYGIDVLLPAGTAIYAPEPGTVVAYQPSNQRGTNWWPGRLLLRLDRGGTIGFGHVNNVTPPNTHVQGGQEIATIGDQGTNSHVEFMYSPSNTANYKRADFTAYPLSDPLSPWSLLQLYMNH